MENTYKLYETTMGVLIFANDIIFAKHEYVRLFNVIDNIPNFLSHLKSLLCENLHKHTTTLISDLNENNFAHTDYVQSYLNSMRVYNTLANIEYPRYQHSKEQALKAQ